MIKLGADENDYQASALLSKKIGQYNENSKKLLPYLEKNTAFKVIDAEQKLEQVIAEVRKHVEPTILLVREGDGDQISDVGMFI